MALYYFDVEGDDRNGREPQEFATVRAAQEEAVRAAGDLMRDEDGKLIGTRWTMEVTDESGRSVLTIRIEAEAHA